MNQDLKTVLVTGGCGYIGSHTVVELQKANHKVVIVDDLSGAKETVVSRIAQITGRQPMFYKFNISNRQKMTHLLNQHDVDAVIHFAGYKSVQESEGQPLKYYRNNVSESVALFESMHEAGVRTCIFSSSATVYGLQDGTDCYDESMHKLPYNVYGRSKSMVEDILGDLMRSDERWKTLSLRYFNPVGAHASGLIGEDPLNVPNNLMPIITRVAKGEYPELLVFGKDYPTPDGTCLRDYIHVTDLAKGHVQAIERIDHISVEALNLGSGNPISVLEMISAFETSSGLKIPYRFGNRREGDLPSYYADPSMALDVLEWSTQSSLHQMCADAWNWQKKKSVH